MTPQLTEVCTILRPFQHFIRLSSVSIRSFARVSCCFWNPKKGNALFVRRACCCSDVELTHTHTHTHTKRNIFPPLIESCPSWRNANVTINQLSNSLQLQIKFYLTDICERCAESRINFCINPVHCTMMPSSSWQSFYKELQVPTG